MSWLSGVFRGVAPLISPVGAGYIGAKDAQEAGEREQEAYQAAIAEQRRQFDLLYGLQKPLYDDSRRANSVYLSALGVPTMTGASGATGADPAMPTLTRDQIISMVRSTPGFQGELDQGLDAINRGAIRGQGLTSGRRLMALQDRGEDQFGRYYQDWLNKVGSAGAGAAPAASSIGAAGQNMAGNVGNLMTNAARAQTQAGVNAANAWAGPLQDFTRAIGFFGGNAGFF